jgi:PAT family acetyl-CoA transporter-like MFS transporter 1
MHRPLASPAIASSLDSVQITPRTPRAARPSYADADTDADHFVGSAESEEVEMSLLAEDERTRAGPGFADGNGHLEAKHKVPLSLEDKRAMVLLCILCTWTPPLPLW